mgnify:FL=1
MERVLNIPNQLVIPATQVEANEVLVNYPLSQKVIGVIGTDGKLYFLDPETDKPLNVIKLFAKEVQPTDNLKEKSDSYKYDMIQVELVPEINPDKSYVSIETVKSEVAGAGFTNTVVGSVDSYKASKELLEEFKRAYFQDILIKIERADTTYYKNDLLSCMENPVIGIVENKDLELNMTLGYVAQTGTVNAVNDVILHTIVNANGAMSVKSDNTLVNASFITREVIKKGFRVAFLIKIYGWCKHKKG